MEGEENIANKVHQLLFNCQYTNGFIFSDTDYQLDDHTFLHFQVKILIIEEDYLKFTQQIKNTNYNNWYLNSWQHNKDINYQKRMDITKEIANILPGEGTIKNQSINLIWAYIDNKWILGEIKYNPYSYKKRIDKPFQYSNSLTTRLSHQIIELCNLVFKEGTIIDPCCGIGTVVIEGLIKNRDIVGTEISYLIANNAKENLKHFKFDPSKINKQNMLENNNKYDILILDMPYGFYTSAKQSDQINILNHSLKMANNIILVSTKEYSEFPNKNFKKILEVNLRKNNLVRYITFWTLNPSS